MSVRESHRATGVAVDHALREKDDFYPTPPEGTQALLAKESFIGPVWEPACGDGAIVNVLQSAGLETVATDLVDRGHGIPRVDFLMEHKLLAPNIVTNPPFKLFAEFMEHALSLQPLKFCMLGRLAVLEGAERGKIYARHPPTRVWVFSKRLKFYRPGWEDTGSGGLIAFTWLVWERGYQGQTVLGWLP